MKTAPNPGATGAQKGFSLVEMMVAMLITMIVMASVFTLLQKGQTSFQREPEVAEMNQNARYGLDLIVRDLTDAGLGENLPVLFAVVPVDGGGDTPDEVVIMYTDTDFPTVLPGAPYGPLSNAATAKTDPTTLEPPIDDPADYTSSYSDGDVLMAIEYPGDCNGDGELAVVPFELTQDPGCSGGPSCPTMTLNHNSGNDEANFNRPQGFDNQVTGDCAIFGVFSMIQYRINPLPPAESPALERRDLREGPTWYPVAANIENLQVQFAIGDSDVFEDSPGMPDPNDPATWITQVRVTLSGRSATADLQGAREGDFDDGNRLRQSFTTSVVLRNITAKAGLADNNYYN
ncbi:MAG TPA: prepilin-type N-terminal cleavage/methylation domain-containing protein [Vicinamibacteria bacterium]|jgi:prepilin-type N-terminal cleavage/methylation domain-containing protein